MTSCLRLVLGFALFATVARADSHTTCKDPSITWWNNQDGLNPCQQYEKLRQICDSEFEVPVLSRAAPGDRCNTQRSDCCCNSVAFTLSMLCLNCQQGVGSGREGDLGIDAGVGGYQMYLNECGAGTNGSLPTMVQNAVCNTGLKLMKYHYEPVWADGAWFEESTRTRVAEPSIKENKTDPGKCDALSPSSTLSSQISSTETATMGQKQSENKVNSSDSDLSNGSALDTTALLGISIGGFSTIVILIALILHLLKKRRKEQARAPALPISRSPTPSHPPPTTESRSDSRAWAAFSDAPSGGMGSRLVPDSTARVALFHPMSSYAPTSHRTSDSYSSFVPPPSSRSPSPPLANPFSDRHRARVPLIRTRDTMSSLPTYRS